MERKGFKLTSQYFKNAGTIWFVIGIILSILSHLKITFFIFPQSDVLTYGKIHPVLSNVFIFGSILSYFFASLFKELDSIKTNITKPEWIGYLAFSIYQLSLIFGIIIIFYGYNQGRTYGEFDFITDNLFLLFFTIVIILSFIYTWNMEKLTLTFQLNFIILAGIMVTYFLGNFGFPNSYITSVPPTSGYQDAMVSSFYKTSIFVFYISLPLILVLYNAIKEQYNISEDINLTIPLFIIVVLNSLSAGLGLNKSSFSNLWIDLGNYIFSAINFILLGIMYILHKLYNDYKEKKPIFFVQIAGILLSLLFLYNGITSLPIVYNYLQYTFSDPSMFTNKMIYILFAIILVYNSIEHKKDIPNLFILLIILGLLFYIVLITEGILISMNINSINNNQIAIKEWTNILSKFYIFEYIKIVMEIIILLLSVYLIPIAFQNKDEIIKNNV